MESLDPADALAPADWELLHAVGDGLLRQVPGDGELVAGIAEDLPEVGDDGLTYTFRIRPDVEFADGLQLTAPLYADSIRRVMSLSGRSSDLVSLYVSDVEATDDQTLVFHIRDRYAFFPTLVAGTTYLPVHPDIYPQDTLVPLPEAPVYGVGPWYIESVTESELVLQANPNYFGEPVTPERIVIEMFETTEEMTAALQNGDVDLLWRGLDPDTASSFAGTDDLTVEAVPGGTMYSLVMNHSRPPTDDPLVRQAIAELVDRQSIADSVLGGAFVPAFSPVPRGYVGSSESFLERYGEPDLSQAITLLTDAGYTESSPAQIELGFPPERFGLDIAAAMDELQLQMESTGLIDVTVTSQPWNTYPGDVVAGTYNMAFLGWLHDYPDPHNYLAPFVLNGGLGGSGENLENDEIVDLVAEASLQPDEELRGNMYEEIQGLFAEEVITIPLWIEHPQIAYRETVAGSEDYENPQSLNVGPSVQLDYRALQFTPDE